MAVAVAVVAATVTFGIYTSTNINNRLQQLALKQEAAFYNGEVAALISFINGSAGGPTPTPGVSPVTLPNDIKTGH